MMVFLGLMPIVESSVGFLGVGRDRVGLTGSPAQLIRGGLLGVGFVVLILGTRLPRLRVAVFALTAFAGVSVLVGVTTSRADLGFDLVMVARLLYGPLLVVTLATFFLAAHLYSRPVLIAVSLYGAVAGSMILGLNVIGLGLDTFGSYSTGFAGFFYAPNDAGLAMLISLAASFSLLLRDRSLFAILSVSATLGGLALLGTRAALLGAVLVAGAITVIERRVFFSRRRVLSSGALLVIMASAVAGFLSLQMVRLSEDPYQSERLSELAEGRFGRIRLASEAMDEIFTRSPVVWLLGEGATAYRFNSSGGDVLAEVDWVDILGGQGLLFAILLHGFYLGFVLKPWHYRQWNRPGDYAVVIVATLVFVGHGGVAGHALTSPTAAGILAPILALAVVSEVRFRNRWHGIPSGQGIDVPSQLPSDPLLRRTGPPL